jgi:hypothetical protein
MDTAPDNKLAVSCVEWKPRTKNSLRGFASIEIPALHLRMIDIAIHVHPNGARWAALPAKPQIDRDGVAIRRDGKIQYTPLLAFTDRKTADAFSHRVIEAVLELAPDALDEVAS